MWCFWGSSIDVASADQQKAAGPQQDHDDENDEDVAMATEVQEEDFHATDVQELKPEQLDSTKASQKGVNTSSSPMRLQFLVLVTVLVYAKPAHPLTSFSSCTGVDSGEMEVQRQEEEEEEERWRDQQHPSEEERAERSTESTIHTVPQLLLETTQVDVWVSVALTLHLWKE